jgi:acetyl esterase/lipase
MLHKSSWVVLLLAVVSSSACAAEPSPVEQALARDIIGPRQALLDVQERIEGRIPRMPEVKTVAEWEKHAQRIRREVLDRVVFRGEAAVWRDAKCPVKWLDTLAGGPGYRIKKLRYEALPGLWIPALLYEPENLSGKVPVMLAVNGHDTKNGKAADYKQIRCINLAKRGMLVLNVEWLGMGQLNKPGLKHYCMNQLDLCGTSGLAPFYLAMTRGLDVLLSLPNADAERVAVSGLSGGGWQTIFVSSLDPRVTLANPVAGYSGFRVKYRDHFKDLGDSEQAPCDLGTIADYTHLTALRAPRPTLLTFNAKDNCCFEAGYALPPLLDAARPIFKLYGKEKALRTHINDDPGTHNFEKDNRQALYRMIGDFFYAEDKKYRAEEIPSQKEVKSRQDLEVDLPERNADFNTLALELAKKLPRAAELPRERAAAEKWQRMQREKLRDIVRAQDFAVEAMRTGSTEKGGLKATFWKLRLGRAWMVPVVELTRGEPKGTAILVNDAGRRADPVSAERLLQAGQRVLAVDLFYFGEAKLRGEDLHKKQPRDFLLALLLACLGDRPLGIQASELAAVARWSLAEHKQGPASIFAVGPRMSLIALIAAALEGKAIGRLVLQGALGSLKELLEQNRSVDQMPEMFCFGLLEAFDVKQLTALVAPRPVTLPLAGERARKELAGLYIWYAVFGRNFDPFRGLLPPGVKLLRDLPYVPNGHERQKLDLYLPEKARGPLPVIVYVHGGAWLGGSKEAGRQLLPLVARGYAIAAANYRLSQHAKFPAQIEDCKTAIRWLRAHAKEYNLDPDHFGAMGPSAGGHLVALLGTTGHVKELEGKGNLDQSSRVQAVVDWFGPTNFTKMGGWHARPDSPEAKLIGGPVADNKDKAAKANPIAYITKDAAPFLIMHGTRDETVPIGQSELLHDALKKAGVETTFTRIEDAGHGGPPFQTPEILKTVEAFFDRHLKPATPRR